MNTQQRAAPTRNPATSTSPPPLRQSCTIPARNRYGHASGSASSLTSARRERLGAFLVSSLVATSHQLQVSSCQQWPQGLRQGRPDRPTQGGHQPDASTEDEAPTLADDCRRRLHRNWSLHVRSSLTVANQGVKANLFLRSAVVRDKVRALPGFPAHTTHADKPSTTALRNGGPAGILIAWSLIGIVRLVQEASRTKVALTEGSLYRCSSTSHNASARCALCTLSLVVSTHSLYALPRPLAPPTR
jgi:hypothetical protein